MAPPRNTRGPKWRRLPEERPQQIIEAAFQEFGEHGLAGARLDDIARRAGVAKGTIYLYFPNKEVLFQEMIRRTLVARLVQAEREVALLTGTATDRLREYIRRWWSYLTTPQFQTVYRLVHGELSRFPDLAHFYAEEVIARSHRLVASLITRGIESGEFRPVDINFIPRILAGLLISHSVWLCQQPFFKQSFTPSAEDTLERLTDFFLHALRPIPGSSDAGAR